MTQFENRNEMIKSLIPPGGVYAELGVLAGEFAQILYETLAPSKLVLIDYFQGTCPSGDADGNNSKLYDLDKCYEHLFLKYKNNDAVQLRKGDTVERLNEFEDGSFDMIYIDADHSYFGCKRDIEAAYKKCKVGGWICGHDYEMNPSKTEYSYEFGIKQAVDDFCLMYDQKIAAKAYDGCVSFAIQKVER